MVLLLGASYWSVISAGLMGGLCFLAKQDYGVMNFCLGSLVLVLTQVDASGKHKRLSASSEILKNPKILLDRFLSLIFFGIAFALPVLVLIYCINSAEFLYWFNYGQLPHEIRKIHIRDFANHGDLFIPACISFYFAHRTLRIDLLFSGLFFLCAFIVSSTSGLDYTAFFFFLFLPLLLQVICDRSLVRRWWVSSLLLLVTLSCLAVPAKYLYRLLQTTALGKAEPFSFRHVYVTRPVQAFPETMPYFKNVMGSDDSIIMIEQLKEALKGKLDSGLKVLNISELTPLYAELGSAPPLHYPLWYHNKISLFPREFALIERDIDEDRFDVIILQDAHGQVSFDKLLGFLQRNPNYQTLRERGFISPTTSTGDTCNEGYCPNHLYVYVRKSLLK